MSVRLLRGARALFATLACSAALSCGGGSASSSLVAPIAPLADEWPAPAQPAADAIDVRSALGCAEGAQIRVHAYLVAVTLPCPVCNVGERTGPPPEGKIGKSPRQRSPDMPGCLPCPSPAATFSDDVPSASATPSAPLRAVGSAEGLQARHVGRRFLLTGTFHAKGTMGPELDVTDVRALEAR